MFHAVNPGIPGMCGFGLLADRTWGCEDVFVGLLSHACYYQASHLKMGYTYGNDNLTS